LAGRAIDNDLVEVDAGYDDFGIGPGERRCDDVHSLCGQFPLLEEGSQERLRGERTVPAVAMSIPAVGSSTSKSRVGERPAGTV